jgi:hypothetical protein
MSIKYTNVNLNLENKVDLQTIFKKSPGYTVEKIPNKAGKDIYFESELIARYFKKNGFYQFLDESKINSKKILTKKLEPDNAILVLASNKLFIIEVKFQNATGLIEEELLLCDFERKQYMKLLSPLGIRIEYVYVLNDWFKKPEYKDILNYIISVNCYYKFNELTLAWLGLPTKKIKSD